MPQRTAMIDSLPEAFGMVKAMRADSLDWGTGCRQAVHRAPAGIIQGRMAEDVDHAEEIELRAGDRIRWTGNDARLGLVDCRTAEVASIRKDSVAFRLEDGRMPELDRSDLQLLHIDHAWASTVHAFQGRTVDNVIAVTEANHPHLTTRKSFYVEISRARHRAELVTDDAKALRERLATMAGERISALEGIGAGVERSPARRKAMDHGRQETPGRSSRTEDRTRRRRPAVAPEPKRIEYDLGL